MTITIYSTAGCVFCKALKSYLSEKNIPFTEKMADQDEAIARELYERSNGFAVPFTIIEKDDGSVQGILGFDRQQIDEVLELK